METRNYFDYKLAYDMYVVVEDLLNKGGIEEVANKFEEVGDRDNGYTSFYGADYNAWVYLINENFDTNKEESWYANGEVDMISYGEGEDRLFIISLYDLEERIQGLVEYGKKNDYTLDDIEKEYKSLEKTIEIIKKGFENNDRR